MTRPLTALSAALALVTALPVQAQDSAPMALTCTMAVICVEANECQQWGQEIAVREGADGRWHIAWDEQLTSEYDVAADLPAPEGALEPTRMRSLFYTDADNQTVQLISLDENGNIVVTMHQPHLRPRAVTGFGLCADAEAGGDEAAEAPAAPTDGEDQ